MAKRGDDARRGYKGRIVLGTVAVLVITAGLGLAWLASQPTTSKACTLGASQDEVGAGTPEAARIRWAAEHDLGVDGEHPDRTSGSGDRVTATYVLDGPPRGPSDPDRTYLQEIVTERGDDGVWRVASANTCEQWSDA